MTEFVRFVHAENQILNIGNAQVFKKISLGLANENLTPTRKFVRLFLNLGFPQEALSFQDEFLDKIYTISHHVPNYKFPLLDYFDLSLNNLFEDVCNRFEAINHFRICDDDLDILQPSILSEIKIKNLCWQHNSFVYLWNELEEKHMKLQSVEKLTILDSLEDSDENTESIVSELLRCFDFTPNVTHLQIEMDRVDVYYLDKILYSEDKSDAKNHKATNLNFSRFQIIELGMIKDYSFEKDFVKVEKDAKMSYTIEDSSSGQVIWRPPFSVDNMIIASLHPGKSQSMGIFYQDCGGEISYLKLQGIKEIPLTVSMIESQSKASKDEVCIILFDQNFNLPEVNYVSKIGFISSVQKQTIMHNIKIKAFWVQGDDTLQFPFNKATDWVKAIKDQHLVQVYIIPEMKHAWTEYRELSSHQEYIEYLDSPGSLIKKDFKHDFAELLQEMKLKTVIELRIEDFIPEEMMPFECLTDYLQQNTSLRGLELFLRTSEECGQVLKSLSDNFVLRTVILTCEEKVSQNILDIAHELVENRISSEIKIIEEDEIVYPYEIKPFTLYYPEQKFGFD